MPTYIYVCERHRITVEEWRSIHDDSPPPNCAEGKKPHPMAKWLTPPAVHGLNPKTNQIDARERNWDRDMPAYKRLRDEGHQPPGIDGARNLEQRANDPWFIKTGGQFGIPNDRTDEINEMLADGQVNESSWSPVEQRKHERKKARV